MEFQHRHCEIMRYNQKTAFSLSLRCKLVRNILTSLLLVTFVLLSLGSLEASSSADWDGDGGEAWQKLLQSARDEGTIIISGPAELSKAITSHFEADTGIAVKYLAGGRRDRRARFNKELAAEKPSTDIYIGGASEIFEAKKGLLAAVAPMLMLPSVLDETKWMGNQLVWVDNTKLYMPQPSIYISGKILINKAQVNPQSITRWSDLLRPELRGKIAATDPNSPGAGQAVVSYLLDKLGPQFIKDLFLGQQVRLSQEERQLVEWNIKGNFPIIFGMGTSILKIFDDAGINTYVVKEMLDAPGYYIGGDSIAITPKSPPHPNAAAVFHNWYLSQHGQQIVANERRLPSNRKDVDNSKSPANVFATTGIAYDNQYEENWYIEKRLNLIESIKDLIAER